MNNDRWVRLPHPPPIMIFSKLLRIIFLITVSISFVYSLFIYIVVFTSPKSIAQNDYSHFYTSGTMTRYNLGKYLYTPEIFDFYQALTSKPYQYPRLTYRSLPFVSLLFTPLSLFSYHTSFFVYFFLSLMLLIISQILTRKLFNLPPTAIYLLSSFVFIPTTLTFMQGQTSILTLLSLIVTAIFLKQQSFFYAGLSFAAFLIKPHLFLVLGLFLFLAFYSKSFLYGLFVGGLFLIVIGLPISGLKPLIQYPQFIQSTETPAFGTFTTTYTNLSSLIGHYYSLPLLLLVLFIYTKKISSLNFSAKISVAILFAIPFSFHVPAYELTLLIIPIFYYLSCSTSIHLFLSCLLYSILYIGLLDGRQPYISVIMLLCGVFTLFSILPKQNPKPAQLPTSSAP